MPVKRILVVGSKGFIGSHCVNYFSNAENTVYGCDVVTDYVDKNYFLIDATNADFKEVFQHHQFDVCINCSGAASVPESMKNPRRDFELNTLNVFRLLDAIRLYNTSCRIVHLSSAAVYGNPVSLPIQEESAVSPISPYGYHKYFSEQVCKEFVSLFGLQIAVVRPFSVYGTGLRKQLFWDVYQKMQGNKPFTLHGTGNETRDFIHIADLLFIIDLLIQKGQFDGNVYNAANGNPIAIKDIIALFQQEAGTMNDYQFNNQYKEGDPLYWQADITKIKGLGYRQGITNRQGLKEYIEWLRGSK